jgi:hypothetical protein
MLEADILENGIERPIIVWGNQIVDGHNRYSIAKKHGLDVPIRVMEFESEYAAQMYASFRQFTNGRPISPARAQLEMGKLSSWVHNFKGKLPEDAPRSDEDIAKAKGVSARTVRRARVLAEADEGDQKAFLAGELTAKQVAAKTKAKRPAKKPEPKDSPFYDNFTRDAKAIALRLDNEINKVLTYVDDLQAFFTANEQYLKHYAPGLLTLHKVFHPIDAQVYALKTLIRCPYPKQDDMACDECYDTGYITEAKAKALEKEYEAAFKGRNTTQFPTRNPMVQEDAA